MGYTLGASSYVVPITYYYDPSSTSIINYSAEGHKIKAMRKSPSVALVVDEIESVNNWTSVLVHSTFEKLQGIDEMTGKLKQS